MSKLLLRLAELWCKEVIFGMALLYFPKVLGRVPTGTGSLGRIEPILCSGERVVGEAGGLRAEGNVKGLSMLIFSPCVETCFCILDLPLFNLARKS